MSTYLNRMLLPDEHVIYTAHLHWAIYRFGALMLLAGALMGHYGLDVAALVAGPAAAGMIEAPVMIVSGAVALIGALDLIFNFIRQVTTEIVVTNQRIILKKGFVARKICEAMMARVTSVNIDQSVLGRIQDYGTVSVESSGADIPQTDHVADPYTFYAHVMRAQRAAFAHNASLAVSAVAPPEERPSLQPPVRDKRAG